MKHVQKPIILFMLITMVISLTTFAQDNSMTIAKRSTVQATEAQSTQEELKEMQAKNGNNSLGCNVSRANASNLYAGTLYLNLLNFDLKLKADQEKNAQAKLERAREVMQANECISTGSEKGIFLSNSLMLDGKPLDYGDFDLRSTGKLTVHKGAGRDVQTTAIPFFISLIRNGNNVLIPGNERCNLKHSEVDLAKILQYAQPGDQLVIEAANKEDGAVKRILKILGPGC